MRALAQLVHDGKTRFVGVSNFDSGDMLEAQRLLGDVPLTCNQVLYHLRERGIEHRLVPAAREARQSAIVGYSPFDAVAPFRATRSRPGSAIGNVARQITVRRRCQVILARLNAWRAPICCDPQSVKHAEHVEENAGAGDLALDDEDMRAIDAAFPIR